MAIYRWTALPGIFSDPVAARSTAGSQTRAFGAQTSDPADVSLRRQGVPEKIFDQQLHAPVYRLKRGEKKTLKVI